jgi:hypothetical protein
MKLVRSQKPPYEDCCQNESKKLDCKMKNVL